MFYFLSKIECRELYGILLLRLWHLNGRMYGKNRKIKHDIISFYDIFLLLCLVFGSGFMPAYGSCHCAGVMSVFLRKEFKPFHATGLLLYLLQKCLKQWFLDVFRRYKKKPVGWKRVKQKSGKWRETHWILNQYLKTRTSPYHNCSIPNKCPLKIEKFEASTWYCCVDRLWQRIW